MRAKRRIPYFGYFLTMTLIFGAPGAMARRRAAPPGKQKEDAAGFKEFSDRVRDYVKLQKQVESKLPALKSTDLPELITAHQQALARMIREARPKARRGDIFTHSACEAFRQAIRAVFASSPADKARRPLGKAAPLKEMHLQVNGIYPDAVPYTAVSPALLAQFPKLPDDVAYRIVVRDIVLIDVKSNMVVDLAHELFPSKP